MRASSFIGLLLCATVTAACSPGTAPDTRESINLRSDTTLAAYVGAPVTWEDTSLFPLVIDPLVDLGEPPLRGARIGHDQRVMRFTWVRSFHKTIIVRVMDLRTACRIVTTVAHPRGFFVGDFQLLDSTVTVTPPTPLPEPQPHPAKVIRRDSTDVTPEVCTELAEKTVRAALIAKPTAQVGGFDGAEWLLERADAQGHVARMNWSPEYKNDRALHEAGLAFLRAAKVLPRDAWEIY